MTALWTPTETRWVVEDENGEHDTYKSPILTVDGGALVFRDKDGSPIGAVARWRSFHRVPDEDPTGG